MRSTGGPSNRHRTDVVRPPRLSEWLAERLLRGDDRRAALGDLREDYAHEVRLQGERAARRWYRREALDLILNLGWAAHQPSIEQLRAARAGLRGQRPGGEDMLEMLKLGGLGQDLRYALRALGRDRILLVLGTLILGIGIAASVSIYSVVRPLLVQSLPFPEAERLVWVSNVIDAGLSGRTSRTSNLRDYRSSMTQLDGVAGYFAFYRGNPVIATGDGEPETLVGVPVSHDFLDVLGVVPALGTDFGPEIDALDFEDMNQVVISHGLWQGRFGGAPDIVGRQVLLDDRAHVVLGVLPQSFDFSSVFEPDTQVDLLTAFPINDNTDNWGNTLSIVGRLADGATLASASSELEQLLLGLREENPRRWGLSGRMSSLQENVAKPFRSASLVLLGSALLMLLIVAVNLSNLLLARTPARAYEMSVRAAHGAPAARLIRQLVLESVLLSSFGALVGVTLATTVVRAVSASTALSIPLLSSAAVDSQALLLSVGLSVSVGCLVGLAPAVHVVRAAGLTGRDGASRAVTGGIWRRRLREGLVVVQVGMACVLLVLGALLLGSFRRLLDVDLGFDADDGWVWQVTSPSGTDSLAAENRFFDAVRSAVSAVPGVERVGLTDDLPFGEDRSWGLGVPGVEREEPIDGFPHIVSDGYLEAMQIRLVEGRTFDGRDTEESTQVAVINQTTARTLFPEGGAVGRKILFGRGECEVIGVVEDVRHQRLDRPASLQVYLSMKQTWDFGTLDLVVYSQLPEETLVAQVGDALRSVHAGLPVTEYRTLRGVMEHSVAARRFTLVVLSAFAATALLLAALGVYGVLQNSVSEQQREIGIRMALGESSNEVLTRVVGRTVVMALSGVVLGAVVLVPARRVVETLLFEISATDPRVYSLTAFVLVAVATAAGFAPALRASRTDSSRVLRS